MNNPALSGSHYQGRYPFCCDLYANFYLLQFFISNISHNAFIYRYAQIYVNDLFLFS